MGERKVVITGIGVISSNGIGKDAFQDALFEGISGIKPISLFDTQAYKVKTAGEVKDFSPQDFLGQKGLRTLDRSTKLLSSAAKLALDDARLEITEENTSDIGVAVGSTMGSVQSISEFDKEAIREGPRYVNPALFPNTVINSPASQVAIKFNIKGFNATLSTGFSASLDAIQYAVDFLRFGRAKIVLAGGVEELCIQTFLGFYKTGFLAGLDSGPEISCPFDKRRNGVILGEGSCMLVLEDMKSAQARRAHIYAEVSGFGTGFDAYRINKYNRKAAGLKKAMSMSLREAGITPAGIDYIASGANSTQGGDVTETVAIKDIFGEQAKKVPVSSVKSMIGECFSASASLQVASALCAIEKQIIPPTINYQHKDEKCDLDYVVNEGRARKIEKVLVNAFGPSGCNSSLILSRVS